MMIRSLLQDQPQPVSTTTLQPDQAKQDSLSRVLAEVVKAAAPLWPLRDYVAVNPFVNLSDRRFLDAYRQLRAVRDCELLAERAHYEQLILRGEVTPGDVEQALRQCVEEYPGWFDDLTPQSIVAHIIHEPGTHPAEAILTEERLYFTLAEVVDRVEAGDWSSHIINDVTRHCAAHFDQGQAAWQSPWKNLPLYTAWRRSASINPRMDMLGMTGYRRLVAELPPSPQDAIAHLLNKLGVPEAYWHGVLLSQMLSVAGWASYIAYCEQQRTANECSSDELISLIAIRLAYDVALAFSGHGGLSPDALLAQALPAQPAFDPAGPPTTDTLIRYAMQTAAETAYRRKTLSRLRLHQTPAGPTTRKAVQMVFCIDVRSEVFRRHLESLDDAVETLGFAGFFGVPIEHHAPGQDHGDAHCPVLIKPAFKASACGQSGTDASAAASKARQDQRWAAAWKQFRTSAASCFSFVESLGLLYASKLLGDAFLRPLSPVDTKQRHPDQALHLTKRPDRHGATAAELTIDDKTDLCAGILKNLGLTSCFARLVVLCGHEAEVVNNPYKAGLACGACGGHSGAPNARAAVSLLNDPGVRRGLSDRGMNIPMDTCFVAAVHNTTTDGVTLLDRAKVPASHRDDLHELEAWLAEAGSLTRAERAGRLNEQAGDRLIRRSRDWSEVRPEWGLAGNAAFLVAPRHRTRGLDLGGRVFMHNYDPDKDPDLGVLELILTAPMIVTSWINLQYYASAVDNRHFGSGTKTLHNVVGNFGVLSGNGGDLMTGLPWQSVHDGRQFQHDPLRLLVVVENTRSAIDRIIHKHAVVRDLTENGWLTIAAIEDGKAYRRSASGQWVAEPLKYEACHA